MKNNVQNVQKAILVCLGLTGILALGVVAPNAVQLLRYLPGVNKSKKNYYVKYSISRLKDKGLIEFVTKNGKTFARLTDNGKQRLKCYQLGEMIIKQPKHWDGRWRIVIFDIKEMNRRKRDQLRLQLRQF